MTNSSSNASNKSPVAIITGGAGGIGSAIARRLARDGITVVIGYSTSIEHAQRLLQEFEAAGQTASAVQADMRRAEDVARLFETVQARHGRIDHVINNAGTVVPRPLAEINDAL